MHATFFTRTLGETLHRVGWGVTEADAVMLRLQQHQGCSSNFAMAKTGIRCRIRTQGSYSIASPDEDDLYIECYYIGCMLIPSS